MVVNATYERTAELSKARDTYLKTKISGTAQWNTLRTVTEQKLFSSAGTRQPTQNSNEKKRLHWAKEYINRTDDQWSQVIWSDETKISLFGSDGPKYVRCRIGEELHPDCIQATVKNPVSVMIWSCMSADGIGHLHVIDGTLNARKYIDTILEPKLLPSIRDLFSNNASFNLLHGKISKEWFRTKSIKLLSWPGNSPDLNPTENLWHRLKTLVRMRRPSNKRELIEALIVSWHHVITKEQLKTLVSSMKCRCEAVIKNKGYPTKY
ncbi:Transposable element Tcb1 transposase, partial [Stegodyphus mimosarum]